MTGALGPEPRASPAAASSRIVRGLHRSEDAVLAALLVTMVVLPITEVGLRWAGMPSTILLVQQLTLAVGLLGAAVASRERRHLSLYPLLARLPPRLAAVASVVGASVTACVALFLAVGSVTLVASLSSSPTEIQGIPQWVLALPLPVGFALVALRETLAAGHSSARPGRDRLVAAAIVVGATVVVLLAGEQRRLLLVPGLLALVLALACGAPLFALLGGAGLLLFAGDGTPIASIPAEAYRLVVKPALPTLPLFTLAGYLLAEGGSSARLLRLFRSLFGWLPGGLAIGAAVACALFTAFTGGSGITILALGGLFLPALLAAGHREKYSLGLLTAGGSLGLLFPPSIPAIMLAVVSNTPIPDLFAGALVPGMLLLAAVAASGLVAGLRLPASRRLAFSMAEARSAAWEAKWEMALPIVAMFFMFGGVTTMVQAAAITAACAFLIVVAIHRDIGTRREVARVLVETGTVIGGVLTILAVALGLTSYLVDVEIPSRAAEWVTSRIDSPLLFLLALNVFLLLVGCLMDIFSAIVVVVPIVMPVAAAYGVEPVHLCVIILANLELGYLTPPVGLNLFLASYRFKRSLPEIYGATMPFLLLLLAVVLLVTYVPWFTTVGLRLVR